jgi:hypothetical protein
MIGECGHTPLVLRGHGMDNRFYANRARVLRELATEADPFIKTRLLRLAKNYDDMTTFRDQAEKKPRLNSIDDSRGSN